MDPNMMAGMGDFLKNPEMMKSAMDMLKNNPGMMEQMMNMGKSFAKPTQTDNSQDNSQDNSPDNSQDNSQDNLAQTGYKCNDSVIIQGLKSDTYNNQPGLIKRYIAETNRYEIYLNDLDKTISIKQNNFIRAIDSETNDDADVEDFTGSMGTN